MGAALGSPEGQAVATDTPNFLDITRFQVMVIAEEDVSMATGPAAAPAG